MRIVIATLIATAAVTGCASPEASRTRGAGRGADVGNRAPVVKMHDGAEPFWKTPGRLKAEHAPIEPARQAERLSRQ